MGAGDRTSLGGYGVTNATQRLVPEQLAWLQALRDPLLAKGWTPTEWERVVRLARRTRLLGRLAEGLLAAGLLDDMPPQVRRHLVAEHRLSRWRTSAVLWTMERVAVALGDAPYPRVLLKGAAYIGQALPLGVGRLPSDLDVLVPKVHLADAQERLARAGWNVKPLDSHDLRYYYEWSHEAPPMTHPLLMVELDLHHNILPSMAHAAVDAGRLLAATRPAKLAPWQVLQPLDQVLHSAAHLFFDSEFRDRIRDLADLDNLLRHFGADPSFLRDLPVRAGELGLEEPLALACHFCVRWFGTPIPQATICSVEAIGPGRLRRAVLFALFGQVLLPVEPDGRWRPMQSMAATLLLTRYHLRRLPLRRLVPHLWHKLRSSRRPVRVDDREGIDA